jgi:hypothetical protein
VSVVPDLRKLVALVVSALVVSACGGGGDAATTTDPQRPYALEYAASARRAIEGTRFEGVGDTRLADLIVSACADLADSSDPDSTVLATVAGVDAPEGDPIDDEIFAVVVAEGVAAVCPDAVQGAVLRGEAETDPERAYLEATASAAFGSGVGDGALLAAGTGVCAVLDGSGSPEDAVLAVISTLYGVEGAGVSELSEEGTLTEDQGILAGSVLGAASSLLCPQHRDVVATYLAVLGS